MANFDDIVSLPIFSNSWTAWLVALVVAAAVFVGLLATRRIIRRYIVDSRSRGMRRWS